MKTRTVRLGTGETLGATRITRRDFLKIGGTGLAGATLLGTAGCGSIFGGEQGGTGGGGGGSKAITVNMQDSIRGLDSAANATDEVSFNVLVNAIEGLYRLDENDQPVPGQAEDVQISEDGLTYTVKLKEGLKFHNGREVTAEDVKFSFDRTVWPEIGMGNSYLSSLVGYEEASAAPPEGEATSEPDTSAECRASRSSTHGPSSLRSRSPRRSSRET